MSQLPSQPSAADAPPIRSDFADDEEMQELVAFFVEEMGERIETFRTALEAQDADRLATLAHQLKGSAGGYGFPSLSEVAGTLEKSFRTANRTVAEVQDEVEALLAMCRRVTL